MSNLVPGSIVPDGWLKEWTRINADGWLLHYAKSRDVGVYGKFWNRNETADVIFDENDQTLTLCDYTAYFADGMVRYAGFIQRMGTVAGTITVVTGRRWIYWGFCTSCPMETLVGDLFAIACSGCHIVCL